MVKSMTGFGKSTLSKEKREYQMEIKSVNHRYLDITIKMPKTLSYLEDEIKKEKGSITVLVIASFFVIIAVFINLYITLNEEQQQRNNSALFLFHLHKAQFKRCFAPEYLHHDL